MRKTLLVLLGVISFLASCGGGSGNNNSSSTVDLRKFGYIDYPTIDDGSLKLTLAVAGGSQSGVSTVHLALGIVSSNLKPVKFNVTSAMVKRESNGAEYTANLQDQTPELTLECDVPGGLVFTATLPTGIGESHYRFSFKGNSTEYVYYLYEKPDSLRERHTVYYSVDGFEGTILIPDGRYLRSFNWVSSDYVYGCNKWYLDLSCTEPLPEDYVVRSDIVIYGKQKSILKYSLYPNGLQYKATGYNFIPSTGEIVIPKYYDEKAVLAISSNSFADQAIGMKKLYIPKLNSVSYIGNFHNCVDLETIYFEGSKDDWEKVTDTSMLSLPEKTKVVFGTYK